MERKTIRIIPTKESDKTVMPSKCKDMIISEILNPLLKIVYQYKPTKSYNNPPMPYAGDVFDYYKEEFNKIYRALNSNIYISEIAYNKIYLTIQALHAFTRKFEGADGLEDFFFEANPRLNYFTFAYSKDARVIINSPDTNIDKEAAPSKAEYSISDAYHAKNELSNQKFNFDFDREDFFVKELAYAVRKIFINILKDE